MNNQRIAVMVDGDNISAKHAARILSASAALGRVDVARVYCAGCQSSDWLATPGFRAMHSGAGKNATDLLLSIDAMELALVGEIDAFVVAASDRDYTHLAHRLREHGRHVLALGEDNTPESFRLACSAFVTLPCNTGSAAPAVKANAVSELDQKIRAVIAKHSTNGCGMKIEGLSAKMRSEHGTQISNYPEKNWRGYLTARPKLYEIGPRGPGAMVRFRPEGFAGN